MGLLVPLKTSKENDMTKYEKLMNESEVCLAKAMFYFYKNHDLSNFYKNASVGFKMKALNLSIDEASEFVK